MSFNITNATARVDLGASGPTFAECTVAVWWKSTSAASRRGLVTVAASTTDYDTPQVFCWASDGNQFSRIRNAGPGNTDATNDLNLLTSDAWQLLIYRVSDAGDTIKLRRNNGSDKSVAMTNAFPGGGTNPRYITLGRWLANDGTSYISTNCRLAHVAVWKSHLSDTQCTNLFNGGSGGGGVNPSTIDASNLVAYWDGSSMSSQVGSLTLSNLDNTITVNDADNPTVDAYSGGDTLAPTVPTGVTATAASESSINTGCDASTDNGGGSVAGYKVQLLSNADAVLATVDKGTTRTHTFTGLTTNTTYKVRWAAYDNATVPNESAYSTPVPVTLVLRKFEFTLNQVDNAGNVTVAANKTGLWWAWWPSIAAVRNSTATASGSSATTNGSGLFSEIAPSNLSVGTNQGFIVISTQDATPDSAEQVFAGPIDVV